MDGVIVLGSHSDPSGLQAHDVLIYLSIVFQGIMHSIKKAPNVPADFHIISDPPIPHLFLSNMIQYPSCKKW